MNCINHGKLKLFLFVLFLAGLIVYPVFGQEGSEKKEESEGEKSVKLSFDITPSTRLTQQEILFLNMENLEKYRLDSYSSISVSISRYLARKTSLQLNYGTHPLPGYKNTDLFLLSSLVIKI
ncbi:MAG: DUF481 domain-containing protein [Candidatus Aminicenantes bacterium]|nr:MAG: DUF481 domain-containing protein [Candidatus Aminicenantes bacterium]